MSENEWTVEEQAVTEASKLYFQAIAACEAAGGRSQLAIQEAMPAEVREMMASPMAQAMFGNGG